MTLQEIGTMLDKDHTTIMNHLKHIGAKMKSRTTYNLIRGKIPKPKIVVPKVKKEPAKIPMNQKTLQAMIAAKIPKFDCLGRRINQSYLELHLVAYKKKPHRNMYNMVI